MAKETNGRVQSWIRIGLVVLAMAMSAYGSYISLRGDVTRNARNIEKVEKTATENKDCVIRMQTDIEYIKKGVDRIEKRLE